MGTKGLKTTVFSAASIIALLAVGGLAARAHEFPTEIEIFRPGRRFPWVMRTSPQQTVDTRKYLMSTLEIVITEIVEKVERGEIAGIEVNARSIAVLASFIPVLFRDIYPEAYPVAGSIFYYKGARPGEMEAEADNLRAEAVGLLESIHVGDPAGARKSLEGIDGACVRCHGLFRGP